MLPYRVQSRILSRQDNTGEVVVTYQGAQLQLPLDRSNGIRVSFRDPDLTWEEKCRLQYVEGLIPHKEILKLAIFMHFGGVFYRYNNRTGMLHIHQLPSYVTGVATLLLALFLVWWKAGHGA